MDEYTERRQADADYENEEEQMQECDHENGTAKWNFWQCNKCGWIVPEGVHRGPNQGFFPSMAAVKMYDDFHTYQGMGDVKPMVPNG